MRIAALALGGVVAVAACTPTDYTGSGPITLSRQTRAEFERYLESRHPGHFIVSEDGRTHYWTHCPEPGGDCRVGPVGGIGAMISRCEAASDTPYHLYAEEGEIVWEGQATAD